MAKRANAPFGVPFVVATELLRVMLKGTLEVLENVG